MTQTLSPAAAESRADRSLIALVGPMLMRLWIAYTMRRFERAAIVRLQALSDRELT